MKYAAKILMIIATCHLWIGAAFAQPAEPGVTKFAQYYSIETAFQTCRPGINKLPQADEMAHAWFQTLTLANGWERSYFLTEDSPVKPTKEKVTDTTSASFVIYPFPAADDQWIDRDANAFAIFTHGVMRDNRQRWDDQNGNRIQVPSWRLMQGTATYSDPAKLPPARVQADWECSATLDEIRMGNGSVEIFHSGACHSMSQDVVTTWKNYWPTGLRVATGFHGISRFLLRQKEQAVINGLTFVMDDKYVNAYAVYGAKLALGWRTRDAVIGTFSGPDFANPKPNANPPEPGEQCPVMLTTGTDLAEASQRAMNHYYAIEENTVVDATNTNVLWKDGISGCDPIEGDPW